MLRAALDEHLLQEKRPYLQRPQGGGAPKPSWFSFGVQICSVWRYYHSEELDESFKSPACRLASLTIVIMNGDHSFLPHSFRQGI